MFDGVNDQERSSQKDDDYEHGIVSSTGPFMLTDTLNAYPREATSHPDEFIHIKSTDEHGELSRHNKEVRAYCMHIVWATQTILKLKS